MSEASGFHAQVRADCRVLVLGSMPGVASLQAGQYYAHPRNRFWPVMAALCGFDAGLAYPQRLAALQAAGGGLWDVLARCRRQGSLDSAIERGSEEPVALAAQLVHWPALAVVACNGTAAAQLYRRHLAAAVSSVRPALRVIALPSTSPANAACSLAQLQQQWQQLSPWLRSAGNAATAHR